MAFTDLPVADLADLYGDQIGKNMFFCLAIVHGKFCLSVDYSRWIVTVQIRIWIRIETGSERNLDPD